MDHQQTQKAKELLEVINRKNFIRPLFEKNIVLFLLVIRFVGWLTVCFHINIQRTLQNTLQTWYVGFPNWVLVHIFWNLLLNVFLQSNWEHHKEVKAAQGVKIIAKELEKSLAGLPMYVAKRDDEVEYYKVQRKLFGFNLIGFRF